MEKKALVVHEIHPRCTDQLVRNSFPQNRHSQTLFERHGHWNQKTKLVDQERILGGRYENHDAGQLVRAGQDWSSRRSSQGLRR